MFDFITNNNKIEELKGEIKELRYKHLQYIRLEESYRCYRLMHENITQNIKEKAEQEMNELENKYQIQIKDYKQTIEDQKQRIVELQDMLIDIQECILND